MTEIVLADRTIDAGEERVGGKAIGLARLRQLGHAVPEFFVVPAEWLTEHLARGNIPACLGKAMLELANSEKTRALRTAILNEPPALELVEAITPALARIGPGPYAVRSSMVGEDSARNSFAGQLDSFLFELDASEVVKSIVRCWASAFGERALSYAACRGLGLAQLRMGVVVQIMVEPEIAGVVFTADPVSGRRDECVVAAAWGLGEGVVSGLDADEYHWRDRELSSVVADKQTRVVRDKSGRGTAHEPVPENDRGRPCLEPDQVAAICQAGLGVARAQGRPQDIEWAFAGGRLFFLQARPITSLPPTDESGGPRKIWDNSNIQESYCGVSTPLTFSFASRAYRMVYEESARLAGVPEHTIRRYARVFASLLGFYRGRVYYDLGNWYRKLALLPSYRRNKEDLDALIGVSESTELKTEATPFIARLRRLATLVGTIVRVVPLLLRIDTLTRRFYAHFEDIYRRLDRASLANAPLWRLMDKLDLLDRELLAKWQVEIMNIAWVQHTSGSLRRLVERRAGDESARVFAELLGGDESLESVAPTRTLLRLAAEARRNPKLEQALRSGAAATVLERVSAEHRDFAARLEDYIERYGDRVMGELKLETVTLRQNPSFLIELLRSYLDRPDLDPERLAESDAKRRRQAEAALEVRLGFCTRRRFRRLLASLCKSVRRREALRLLRTRLFGLYREVYCAIGDRLWQAGRLEHPRDVFYLTVEEIAAFHEGRSVTTDLSALAHIRKRELASCAAEEPPNRFETTGPVYQDAQTVVADRVSSDAGVLRGIGCCPGVVSAPIKIVRRPQDGLSLDGRILVALRTDPGWAPLFPAAGGLIVERGSTLSHSAVVARELGLPTVVGVPDATRVLVDGERVRLDGGAGIVEREGK